MGAKLSQDYKFGIKINLTKVTCQQLDDLFKSFDYIEYKAPVSITHFDILESKSRFVPHSVMVSLSHKNVNEIILSRLMKEVDLLKPDYIGEHIGSLSQDEYIPSLGYVIPPKLNLNSVKTIVKNVCFMEEKLGLKLALENPVFYTNNGEYKYLEFMRKLNELLPASSSWLIDFSHLYVTSQNLGISFEECVKFYSESKRSISEVHISNYKLLNGVHHDSHSSFRHNDIPQLEKYFYLSNFYGLCFKNITLEIDDLSLCNESLAIIKSIVNNDVSSNFNNSTDKKTKNLDSKLNRNAEKLGREKILNETIEDQIQSVDGIACYRKLIKEDKKIVSSFYNWLKRKRRSKENDSIPYYIIGERDSIDLLGELVNFLILNKNLNEIVLAEFIFEVAIKCASCIYFISDNISCIVFTTDVDIPILEKGSHILSVTADSIGISDFLSEEFLTPEIKYLYKFDNKRGFTCQRRKKGLVKIIV